MIASLANSGERSESHNQIRAGYVHHVTSGAKLTEKRRFEFAEASRTDERFPVAFS